MATGATLQPTELWISVAVKLGRLVERNLQELLDPFAVSAGQYLAMVEIHCHPGVSRADLARSLHLTPQAVGGLVTTLTEKHLLDRTDHEPGRPIALTLTPTGREVVRQIAPEADALARRLLSHCFRGDTGLNFGNAMSHVLNRLAACLDRRSPGAVLARSRRS